MIHWVNNKNSFGLASNWINIFPRIGDEFYYNSESKLLTRSNNWVVFFTLFHRFKNCLQRGYDKIRAINMRKMIFLIFNYS